MASQPPSGSSSRRRVMRFRALGYLWEDHNRVWGKRNVVPFESCGSPTMSPRPPRLRFSAFTLPERYQTNRASVCIQAVILPLAQALEGGTRSRGGAESAEYFWCRVQGAVPGKRPVRSMRISKEGLVDGTSERSSSSITLRRRSLVNSIAADDHGINARVGDAGGRATGFEEPSFRHPLYRGGHLGGLGRSSTAGRRSRPFHKLPVFLRGGRLPQWLPRQPPAGRARRHGNRLAHTQFLTGNSWGM